MKRGNWTDHACYYVTARDAGRVAYILGPFRTEDACREWAYRDQDKGGDPAKAGLLERIADRVDPRSWFWLWGMAKAPNGYRTGALNHKIRPDGIWTGEAVEIPHEEAA